ncbi:M20/M25/M40 family metallo-hydrolase [Pendulispora brunnea]|uniref:M20/M25/M40 family metallo-hydrolase n=1 Tax=Pendulispora brunnea TaxID=2905690 RepID=A0ABZ2K3C7_9BACT
MLNTAESQSASIATWIDSDIRKLSMELGERNDGSSDRGRRLRAALDHVSTIFREAGRDPTEVGSTMIDGNGLLNVECTVPGTRNSEQHVVLGAHIDSARGAPGADDNASGVAMLLGLARVLGTRRFPRTVHLVAFVNEEPPHTRRPTMGSLDYARQLRRRGIDVTCMVSLESLGFDPAARPQDARWIGRRFGGLYFVSNLASRQWCDLAHRAFRHACGMSALRIAAPGFLPGIRSSDHWSFWKMGFPAIMVTDGGPLVYKHYHRPSDTAEKVDVAKLVRMVPGMMSMLARLAGVPVCGVMKPPSV